MELLGGLEGPGCGTAGTLAVCLLTAVGVSYGLSLWFALGLCGWQLRRPLVLVLESVGGTAGWLPALVAVGLANLRCIRQYHAAIHSGAGH